MRGTNATVAVVVVALQIHERLGGGIEGVLQEGRRGGPK